jgi:hypothetical protein
MFKGVALACVLAAVMGISACSSGRSSNAASGAGRVQGDNGKLLPPDCWISFGLTGGGYSSLAEVVNANGGSVNCSEVVSELSHSVPSGLSASVTSSPSVSDLGNHYSPGCTGVYYGDKVAVYLYHSGSVLPMDPDPTCQAFLLNNG